MKLGFLIGNLNASCFSVNLFLFYFLFFLWSVEMETYLLVYLKTLIMPFPHHFFPGYNNPLNLSSEVQFSPL